MNGPIRDLVLLLRNIKPEINPGVFAFVSVTDAGELGAIEPIATIREREGLSAVVSESDAMTLGLPIMMRAAWITLNVQSDLQAVGFTAAVSRALAMAGISCNMVAGAWHDHIFVPVDDAQTALETLRKQQRDASS